MPVKSISALFVSATLLGACSTEIGVSGLPADKPAGEHVNGVPFRTRGSYTLQLYKKGDHGYELVTQTANVLLPDYTHLYVLHADGGPLADSDTKYTMRPDGTLQSVTESGSSTADKAITEVSKDIGTVKTAIDTQRTAQQTALAAAQTNSSAYCASITAVLQAEAGLADATQDDKTRLATAQVACLKASANAAAQKAGVALPYPDLSSPTP